MCSSDLTKAETMWDDWRIRDLFAGNSLVVQWLGLSVLTAGARGSIPGGGIKVPQAARQKNERKKEKKSLCRQISHM